MQAKVTLTILIDFLHDVVQIFLCRILTQASHSRPQLVFTHSAISVTVEQTERRLEIYLNVTRRANYMKEAKAFLTIFTANWRGLYCNISKTRFWKSEHKHTFGYMCQNFIFKDKSLQTSVSILKVKWNQCSFDH